jgi:hypothetical protein
VSLTEPTLSGCPDRRTGVYIIGECAPLGGYPQSEIDADLAPLSQAECEWRGLRHSSEDKNAEVFEIGVSIARSGDEIWAAAFDVYARKFQRSVA